MLHYNGVWWKSYISQTGIDGAYLGLSVSGNTVIAVGYLSSSQAIILMEDAKTRRTTMRKFI